MWYCPHCSSAVEPGAAACWSCGHEISRSPPTKLAAPVAPLAEPAAEPPAAAVVVTSDMQSEINALLAENRVIEAIKIYRERMRVGLKEAKEAIDEMRAAK